MPGKRPEWRFLMKDEGGKLTELGAAWETSKANIFSVSMGLEGTGEKINFMMIKNQPRTAQTEQPAEQPATPAKSRAHKASDHRPAA